MELEEKYRNYLDSLSQDELIGLSVALQLEELNIDINQNRDSIIKLETYMGMTVKEINKYINM